MTLDSHIRLSAAAVFLAVLAGGAVSASHSHAWNPLDAADVRSHTLGECEHAPGQPHSDREADNCVVCLILQCGRCGLASDGPSIVLVAPPQDAWAPIDSHDPATGEETIGSRSVRGPPQA